eukprot:COSAG01_NODE_12705_length_1697_cov_1.588235_2_plen_123_part_00
MGSRAVQGVIEPLRNAETGLFPVLRIKHRLSTDFAGPSQVPFVTVTSFVTVITELTEQECVEVYGCIQEPKCWHALRWNNYQGLPAAPRASIFINEKDLVQVEVSSREEARLELDSRRPTEP